jgi:hypothetical membrane protein
MQTKNRLVISVFFALYAATFLPNFGLFNQLSWIGPVTQPMAWILMLNLINTALIVYIYYAFFKPFAERNSERSQE